MTDDSGGGDGCSLAVEEADQTEAGEEGNEEALVDPPAELGDAAVASTSPPEEKDERVEAAVDPWANVASTASARCHPQPPPRNQRRHRTHGVLYASERCCTLCRVTEWLRPIRWASRLI
jgi:hypothetical protein